MFMPNVVNTENATHYSILGITNKASVEEIKKAYRKLSLNYHPDRNNNNPEKAEIYKKITAAYNILSNESERKKYDFSLTHGTVGIDIDPAFFMNMFMNPIDAQTIINEFTNLNCSTIPFGKNMAMGMILLLVCLFVDHNSKQINQIILMDFQNSNIVQNLKLYLYLYL